MAQAQASGVTISEPMQRLSAHMAAALSTPLPEEAQERAKLHILDTLAAILSGAGLLPGRKAIEYVRALNGRGESLVLGTSVLTGPVDAALANAMSAHADETDDSHAPALLHPGCIVLPAALAGAEHWQRGGQDLIRATALGYELVVRFSLTLGAYRFHNAGHCVPSFAGVFGAGAAAAALAGLDAGAMRQVLSYCGQQASGLSSWRRDPDHIEKAFAFGGMAARNGMSAATMVAAGMTGVPDIFAGNPNFVSTYTAVGGTPETLVEDLGQTWEIARTNIKKWCVGSPVQAPLDAVEHLMANEGLTYDAVRAMRVHLPTLATTIVDKTTMADLDVRYLLGVLLLDGGLSFEAAHDHGRMHEPRIEALRGKIEVVPSDELEALRPERQSIVEVETTDGRRLRHHTIAVRGTQKNRMTPVEIEDKARGLLAPVLGDDRAGRLIDTVRGLERVGNVRDLRPLLEV